MVAALRRSGVAVPGAPPAARGRPAGHVFLLGLASVLAAQDPPVTLVLDDLHLLTDPEVLDGLGYVLRNAGGGLRLVAAARMDPLLPLHRYRLAGELAEIGAGDLAFTTAETGLLLARHGATLTAESTERLTRRTEGWAAGLRLAAISMGAHPDPDRFVTELITEDSAVTGYLVQEVLGPQPPEVRDVLLSTSILEQVSGEAAIELTGNEQAAGIWPAVARANGFVQLGGSGWYRYHPLFAEVLRLTLRREHPDRLAGLHRRAARWHERNGQLTEAVRHAAQAGDWPLAASMVIDELAISEIIERGGGSPCLAGEFAGLPPGRAWTEPEPHLISAAVALSAGRPESSMAALNAADGILARLPADQQAAGRWAAALIRLAASRRTGEYTAAAAAAAGAQALISRVPGGKLARHPEIRPRVLSGRGAVELWSGHLDAAARVLEPEVAAQAASGGQDERADLPWAPRAGGGLARPAAPRGHAGRPGDRGPDGRRAAGGPAGSRTPRRLSHSPGCTWDTMSCARRTAGRFEQADAALSVTPDKLIGAVAWLAVAYGGLAAGRAAAARQSVARARSGWPVPAWLEQRLSLAESRAYAAAGDIPAALAAAERAGRDTSPEAAVTLAHAWAAAGDAENARRALAPALAADSAAPDRVRLQAWLVDARLSYNRGDRARGRRSLACALRLAGPEQLRCRHSPSSAAGSSRCCAVTRNWPAATGTCSPRPFALIGSRLRRAPPRTPRSWWSSRSPHASGRCYGTPRAC